MIDDGTAQMREVEEQDYNQLALQSTSTNIDQENLNQSKSVDVPMETESSQSDAQASEESTNNRTEHDNVWDESRNADETSCSNMDKQENMMENLQDRLRTMRDGFLER